MEKKILVTFITIFFTFLLFSNSSKANNNQIDYIKNNYLTIISFCEKDKAFSKFLLNDYGYDNRVYQKMLQIVLENYTSSVVRLEVCTKRESDAEKQKSSSEWIKKLSKNYDKDLLRKKRNEVIKILGALHFKSSRIFCENDVKDAFYYENLCYGAFEQYVKLYKTYLSKDNMDNKDKIKIIEELSIAIDNKIVVRIYNGTGIRDNLPLADAMLNTDAKLLKYMEEMLYFSSPFDLVKAIDDFDEYIDFKLD